MFSVFISTGKNDSNTLGVNAYIYIYIFFFLNKEVNFSVFNNIRIRVDWA